VLVPQNLIETKSGDTSLGADLIMAKSVVLLLEVHAAGYWMDIAK
jgi:hypothetical protein